MKSLRLYPIPVALVKLLSLLLLTTNGGVASAQHYSQLYREQGDQTLEAAVMESEIILDAIQSSLEGASIVNILYGHNVIGFNYAPGMHVRLDEMPALALPTHETRDRASIIVEPPLSEKLLSNMSVRMLLFRQRERELSMNRWGFKLERKPPTLASDAIPAPRIFLGDAALSWFAFLSRDAGKRETGDNKWFVKTMVQDVEYSKPLETRQNFEQLRVLFGLKTPAKEFIPRYYATPSNIQTWDQVLARVQSAVAIKAKFDEISDNPSADEEWSFYLEQLKEENLYSNYALRGIAAMGGPEIAKKLLGARAELRLFVDDAWETALRMVLNDPYFKVADRLNTVAVAMAAIDEPTCVSAALRNKSFSDALKLQGEPQQDQSLGLAEPSKYLKAAKTIYEAELRCQLLERKLDKNSLIPQEPTRDSGLYLPANRGYTVDEIGLVSTTHKLTAADYVTQQAPLKEFSFPMTNAVLDSVRSTPTGVRVLLDVCADGLERYQEVALPDLTRGGSYIWREACRVIDDFEWPENYCDPPDSGIGRDVTDISLVLARSVLVAIEQDDEGLLERTLGLLVRNPSYERAQIAGMLISLTRQYANKPVRAQLLQVMDKLPYYPVARALAEEMTAAGSEQATRIARTLQQVTGAEGIDRTQAKSWIFYLNEISEKRKQSLARPLITGSGVTAVLNKKPCSELEYGWNRLFRNKQL